MNGSRKRRLGDSDKQNHAGSSNGSEANDGQAGGGNGPRKERDDASDKEVASGRGRGWKGGEGGRGGKGGRGGTGGKGKKRGRGGGYEKGVSGNLLGRPKGGREAANDHEEAGGGSSPKREGNADGAGGARRGGEPLWSQSIKPISDLCKEYVVQYREKLKEEGVKQLSKVAAVVMEGNYDITTQQVTWVGRWSPLHTWTGSARRSTADALAGKQKGGASFLYSSPLTRQQLRSACNWDEDLLLASRFLSIGG